MTIKASGSSLSLVEIAAEYNGTGSHSLSEYYGAPALPSSGAISFSDFYGRSDVTVGPNVNTTMYTTISTNKTTWYVAYHPKSGWYSQNRQTATLTSRATTRSTTSEVSWSATHPT